MRSVPTVPTTPTVPTYSHCSHCSHCSRSTVPTNSPTTPTHSTVHVCDLPSKHVFIPNFADMDCGYAEINPQNTPLIESCYEARTEKELAVLIQYIDRTKLPAPKATHMDIILYSREQITKENLAMGTVPPNSTAPWGIISVKGQLCDYELPMQPITIMRNALGAEHGGSGVPLDFDKYAESVTFWRKYVALK
jgi:hypothetical protein